MKSECIVYATLFPLQNYVTCALGIHYVGFVMICFGATNSLCSFAFGRLAQYTGRIALFSLGNKRTGWHIRFSMVASISIQSVLLHFYSCSDKPGLFSGSFVLEASSRPAGSVLRISGALGDGRRCVANTNQWWVRYTAYYLVTYTVKLLSFMYK